MKEPYRWIDHTADIGIEVFGAQLADVFVHSAQGMMAIITESSDILPKESREILLQAANLDELIVAWLRELHFIYEVENILFCRYTIQSVTDTQIEAVVWGEPVDLDRHRILTEIKAVTYHELSVEETGKGFVARIIFDL